MCGVCYLISVSATGQMGVNRNKTAGSSGCLAIVAEAQV